MVIKNPTHENLIKVLVDERINHFIEQEIDEDDCESYNGNFDIDEFDDILFHLIHLDPDPFIELEDEYDMEIILYLQNNNHINIANRMLYIINNPEVCKDDEPFNFSYNSLKKLHSEYPELKNRIINSLENIINHPEKQQKFMKRNCED